MFLAFNLHFNLMNFCDDVLPIFSAVGDKEKLMRWQPIDMLKMKINQWFNEPLGVPRVTDSTETELKKPFESFETSKSQPKRGRGRGDKREVPHRIEEFYPRGAAGRREVHGSQGPHKAAMPHQGNRPKYPK
jgi:hypothetical protein